MTADTYNYRRFDEYVQSGEDQVEFSAFPNHLHVGDPAPTLPPPASMTEAGSACRNYARPAIWGWLDAAADPLQV